MDARGAKRMSAVPVASYLIEFGSDGDAVSDPASPPPLGSDDTLARVEAAHASGIESGKAAALAALDARLEEQRALFARQLACERQAWAVQEADKLAARLAAGLGELEARLAEATARVLEPFLRAELRQQVIADLRAELEVLLTKEPGLSVSVAGPEDLLHALRDQLSGRACAVTYQPNGEPDVRITAGQTILETRLETWAAKIEETVR
jgi:hypothetical protein